LFFVFVDFVDFIYFLLIFDFVAFVDFVNCFIDFVDSAYFIVFSYKKIDSKNRKVFSSLGMIIVREDSDVFIENIKPYNKILADEAIFIYKDCF